MTSSHQEEATGKTSGAPRLLDRLRTKWTKTQLATIAAGMTSSVVCWLLTGRAYDTGNDYLNHLLLTIAATLTLGTIGWACWAASHNITDRRMAWRDELAEETYDRQEELAGRILDQLTQAAHDLEERQRLFAEGMITRQAAISVALTARQEEIATNLSGQLETLVGVAVADMTEAWHSHQKGLDRIRKRIRSVVIAVEDRNRDAQTRYDAFSLKADELNGMIDGLTTFLTEVLPDAQIKQYAPRRPSGG